MPSTVSERVPTPAARAEIHPLSIASNKPWGDHSIRKKPAANRPRRHDKTNRKTKTNLIGSLSLNPRFRIRWRTVFTSLSRWYLRIRAGIRSRPNCWWLFDVLRIENDTLR